ncbi:trypsin-like peptidase domain-containing protein [Paenibacillus dendritiformis]|uniref:S1C family serine protease n=1 Tax=Paenibacillus dendritiformis TaxID=130049 RepID=UPI00248CF259|nr:trypsin-like peptidase domain-containing protein [Paenibacillus dendritiformis]WGU94687.1 trypsin-like peptidase domain-containing protein [Paenibacillus dendritiformis]
MDEQRRKLFFTSDTDSDSYTTASDETRSAQDGPQAGDAKAHKPEDGGAYYFAYGPYQSVKQSEGSTTTTETSGKVSEVEVTPPAPVKPMPFSRATGQGAGSSFHSGGGGGNMPPQPPQGNWQFNEPKRKRGTSFRAMFASFLAGMLVITGLMYAADTTNLFTGRQELASTASPSESAVVTNGTPVPFPNGASSVPEVVKKTSPAVVKIETLARVSTQNGYGNNPWMNDPFFRQFFGDSFGGSGNNSSSQSQQLQPLGIGTGFIFDKSGYILTNQHVISGAEVIQVTVEGYKKPLKGTLLGQSQDLDLAVIKIEGEGDFPTVPLGDSDAAQVGEQVVAIGNPSGFDHTVTSGVLSARERSINVDDNGSAREYEHLLQTDASINPGNSGGPLLNMKGEVIGMNVAVSKQAQGIGFAIPSNVIKKVVDDLKANREIPKEPIPFIGATLQTMTSDIAQEMGIKNVEGSLVLNVMFGSPSYEADLRAYDIIVGMDGTKYATKEELIEAIQKKKVDDTVTMQVVRNGKEMELKIKLGDRNKFDKQIESQQQQP